MIVTNTERVKIAFRLEQDEDGYPPAGWETMWAIPLGGGRFRLDSIPFFAWLVSCDDVVRASPSEGMLLFDAVAEAGGHSTIRVIAFDDEVVPGLRVEQARLGCSTELSHVPCLFAVDVPPDVSCKGVIDLLSAHAAEGIVELEESCIQHDAAFEGWASRRPSNTP